MTSCRCSGAGALKGYSVPRRGAFLPSQLTEEEIFPHTHHRTAVVKMLYLVGLGLSDETDITVKGLEVAKTASRVYLEAYTSILLVNQSVLV